MPTYTVGVTEDITASDSVRGIDIEEVALAQDFVTALVNHHPPLPILPNLHGFSLHKRPTFATTVQTAPSGREVRQPQRPQLLWEFELTYEVLRSQTQNQIPDPNLPSQTEFDQVSTVFLACGGQFGWFLFNDPSDNSRTGQAISTGDGVSINFLMVRTLGYTPIAFSIETVGAVNLDETITVYVNGTPVPESGNWFIANDLITLFFFTPPNDGDVITADFSFYYKCRFITDSNDFEQFYKNFWLLKSLRFRSARDVLLNAPNYGPLPSPPLPPGMLRLYNDIFPKNCYDDTGTALFFHFGGVQLQDSHGDDIDTPGVPITISILSGPGGGVLSGTLTQNSDSGGSAFWDQDMLNVNIPGTYTFQATAPGFSSASRSPITLNLSATTICLDNVNFILSDQFGIVTPSYYMLAAIVFNNINAPVFRITSIPNFGYNCDVLVQNNAVELGGTNLQAFFSTGDSGVTMHQLIVAADQLTGIIQLVLDGAPLVPSSTFFGAANLFTPTDEYAQWNSENLSGLYTIVGDVFFTLTSSLFDLTISSNVDKLWDSGSNKPVDLSGNPSSVTGSPPLIYAKGNPSNYLTNYGSVYNINTADGSGGTPPFPPGVIHWTGYGFPP